MRTTIGLSLSEFYPDAIQQQNEVLENLFSEHKELQQYMKLVQEVKAKFPLPNYQEENLSLAFNLEISNLEHFFTSKYKAFLIDFSQLQKSQFTRIKKYKNCIYFGEMANHQRNGSGILINRNGNTFEGEWRNNFKHGHGIERLINLGLYFGEYVNGKPEGRGSFKWSSNNETYIGQWLDGKKHGIGMWRTANGDSFLGNWICGNTEGLGLHVWTNGDVYIGKVKNNLKHGLGKEYFSNKDVYEGSYGNGKPNGYGHYTWSSGSIYQGYFTNGLRNGSGLWMKQMNDQTDLYEGEYVNDRKCGKGVQKWSDGTYYEGDFYDDKRNGYGEIVWVDGAYYKGNWANGLMNGFGEFGCENGVFKGEWKDNTIQISKFNLSHNNLEQSEGKLSFGMISLTNFPIAHFFKTNQDTEEERPQPAMNVSKENFAGEKLPMNNEGSTNTNEYSSQSFKFQFSEKQKSGAQIEGVTKDHLHNALISQSPQNENYEESKENQDESQLQNQAEEEKQEEEEEEDGRNAQVNTKSILPQVSQSEEFNRIKSKQKNLQIEDSNQQAMSQGFLRFNQKQIAQKKLLSLKEEFFDSAVQSERVPKELMNIKRQSGHRLNYSVDFSHQKIKEKKSDENSFAESALHQSNHSVDISQNQSHVYLPENGKRSKGFNIRLANSEKSRMLGYESLHRISENLKRFAEKGVQTVQMKDASVQTMQNKTQILRNSQQKRPLPKVNKNIRILKKLSQVKNVGMSQSPSKYYETGFDIGIYIKQLMKERRKQPLINYLNEQEMKVWMLKLHRNKINPKRYENIWNAFTIKRIRNHLYPPVWIPPSQNIQF